jgi:hypothetical protein
MDANGIGKNTFIALNAAIKTSLTLMKIIELQKNNHLT